MKPNLANSIERVGKVEPQSIRPNLTLKNQQSLKKVHVEALELDGNKHMKELVPKFEDKINGPISKKSCPDSNNIMESIKVDPNDMQNSNVGICIELSLIHI